MHQKKSTCFFKHNSNLRLIDEIRRSPVEVGSLKPVIYKVFLQMMIPLMEEILHHLIGSLSHYLRGFIHPRWLALGFLPSTVGKPTLLSASSLSSDFSIFYRTKVSSKDQIWDLLLSFHQHVTPIFIFGPIYRGYALTSINSI